MAAAARSALRGFTRRNLFRMRQFHDTYRGDEKVSALLTQLPWTHHLIILGQAKRPEEREFYLRLAIRERWGSRELERQLRAAAFEWAVLGPAKVSPLVTQMHPEALGIFKDSYLVEFFGSPTTPTAATRKSHRWCDNCRGRTTSSSSGRPSARFGPTGAAATWRKANPNRARSEPP